MKYLFFLLISLFIFSCGGSDQLDLPVTYEGKMTYITEWGADHINRRDTTVFENFIVVLDDGVFRRYAAGNEGCDGAYTVKNNIFTAETEDCDCWCNCAPEIDCRGDLILGSFEIIDLTPDRFVLESYFENDFGGRYIEERFVELERQ